MNITKVNPLYNAKVFGNLIEDVFNRSIGDFIGSDLAASVPAVNISENNDNFLLELAAPGLNKNDFNIAVEKDQLIVSAASENEKEEAEEGKWTRKEFNYTSFRRSFHLSEIVDAENIQAEYTNGILKLTLPKKEEAKAKEPRTIQIK
jgi:HSP20 family protein